MNRYAFPGKEVGARLEQFPSRGAECVTARSATRIGDAMLGHPTGQRFGRIVGVGAYRPRRVVGNDEIGQLIGRTPEWIESRSGIRTRCFADDTETLSVMGTVAAGKA